MATSRRKGFIAAGVALATAVMPAAAAADRPPSAREAAAIKRVAMKKCGGKERGCEFGRARVSTRNPRFAWADVVAEGFSAVLLKRRTAHARRFKVAGIQGGGIGACGYWRSRAPAGVLRDLRVRGVVDDSGAVRNCGKGG